MIGNRDYKYLFFWETIAKLREGVSETEIHTCLDKYTRV